ncbi:MULTISPECIES: GNAT family N-acetyltransferase [unclassified Paenibacillus]|uniref:GNAT family N-acetyltransferase n=1 Tax=unclassified Paenibacillus TaxID=185978 RepID=UPI00104D24EE|nr:MULTISPECIES: GNAT family N-acetyltransferase [unclassified Paenibacillus]NIK71510.1 GNAT superfamily N-acetyltransferase [Paenibacillus sp. BK720]TCM96158.1 acetyltransferase (GNAT) family protein [Paenibacillus sp. BK033]
MLLTTLNELDNSLWPLAKKLYEQSFPKQGRKPDAIINGMFRKMRCFLHTLADEGRVQAMALSGLTGGEKILLIDYIAVSEQRRGEGIGSQLIAAIEEWAQKCMQLDGLLIEVESEQNRINEQRIRFWERNGFTITDYEHSYIWVPEPYRAMYKPLSQENAWLGDGSGRQLFRYITAFHEKAYSKK